MSALNTTQIRNILIGLLVGLILGWLFGAYVMPPRFVDATPEQLSDFELAVYADAVVAAADLRGGDPYIRQAFCRWNGVRDELPNRIASLGADYDVRYIDALNRVNAVMQADAQCPGDAAAPAATGGGLNLFVLLFGIVAVLGVVAAAGYFLWLGRQPAADIDGEPDSWTPPRQAPEAETRPAGAAPEPRSQPRPTPAPTPTPAPAPVTPTTEPDIRPLAGFQTTYNHGDEGYDKSFIIENANGDFLGECGVSVSETIGTNGGRHVTAFEVWLFDKTDTRTVTKVIMSDHAYNDGGFRAKLATRGEPVAAQAGETVALETASLIINATLSEVAYAADTAEPNSGFNRLTVQLGAWVKADDTGATRPAARSADDMLEF